MTLASIIAAGILTYFTRMTMIALISRDMLGDKIKAVLEYVPVSYTHLTLPTKA